MLAGGCDGWSCGGGRLRWLVAQREAVVLVVVWREAAAFVQAEKSWTPFVEGVDPICQGCAWHEDQGLPRPACATHTLESGIRPVGMRPPGYAPLQSSRQAGASVTALMIPPLRLRLPSCWWCRAAAPRVQAGPCVCQHQKWAPGVQRRLGAAWTRVLCPGWVARWCVSRRRCPSAARNADHHTALQPPCCLFTVQVGTSLRRRFLRALHPLQVS